MFSALCQKLGFVLKVNRIGSEIDYKNCWLVSDYPSKIDFFRFLLKIIPDDCVWSIEGIYNEKIIETFSGYTINDNFKVYTATFWPKQPTMKIGLSSENKKLLMQNIDILDFENDFIHQHIYKDNVVYFTSYDNLSTGCTWISKLLSNSVKKYKSDFHITIEDVIVNEK